ncbi:MAG: hypothetical protein VYE22_27190 [Myxococcota bacterium]|nr:hypothetical protein [Myxococcota bacterium]
MSAQAATDTTGDEEDRAAEARERFAEGVAHAQEARWEEAVTAFRAALALRDAPTIRYNLAAAEVERGAYRAADAQLRAMGPDAPASLVELAAALRERMNGEAGRLRVERAAELDDTDVTLDAEPLEADALAGDVYVAPGEHVVEAARDGRQVARVTVLADAGQRTRVYLGVGANPIADPAPAPQPTPLHEEWGFWAAIGGGALLVVGVIVLAVALGSGGTDPVRGNFEPAVLSWP